MSGRVKNGLRMSGFAKTFGSRWTRSVCLAHWILASFAPALGHAVHVTLRVWPGRGIDLGEQQRPLESRQASVQRGSSGQAPRRARREP